MPQWPAPGEDVAAVERDVPPSDSGIVDLSGVSLEKLRSMDGPALLKSLGRLIEEMDDPYSVRVAGSSPPHRE